MDVMKQYQKRFIAVITVIFCIAGLCVAAINSNKESKIAELTRNYELSDSEYSTKTIIVKGYNIDTSDAINVIQNGEYNILQYKTEEDAKEALEKYEKLESVESVEIDAIMEVADSDEIEEVLDSTEKVDSDLKKFLDENVTDKEIKVAIIDTGIDKEHSDLKNRMIDLGVNLSTSGEKKSISDDNGHGTDMAKIIVENTNDNVKIMPIKVANSEGKTTVLAVCEAVKIAEKNGADVINISLNATISGTSEILNEAIDYAEENGITVVVSAGNSGNDTKYYVPANNKNAVVVSAVNQSYYLAGYSNYGDSVDYAALGVYENNSGTSYAAALVSGIVANIRTMDGYDNTQKVQELLNEYTVQNENESISFGNGILSLVDFEIGAVNTEYINNDEDNKYILTEEIIDLDWKNISDEELNNYMLNSQYEYVGYFLSSLSEKDLKEVKSRSEILQETISVLAGTYVDETEIEFDENSQIDINYADYCIEKYNMIKDELEISEWTISNEATFYMSFWDKLIAYKYTISGIKNTSRWVSSTDGVDDLLDKDEQVEVSYVKAYDKSGVSGFVAPKPGKIDVYVSSARCHEWSWVANSDSSITDSAKAYHHIPVGNDDGMLQCDISISFTNYNQAKTGYHTKIGNVKAWKWLSNTSDNQKSLDWNATKEYELCTGSKVNIYKYRAQYYDYEYVNSTGNSVTYEDKADEVKTQTFNDKKIYKGTLTIYSHGVYKDGKSYKESDASTQKRSALKSEVTTVKKNIKRAAGDHTLDTSKSKDTFTLQMSAINAAGIITKAGGKKVWQADIPNYVFETIVNEGTIHYNANGGTGSISDKSMDYETASINLANPASNYIKNGYHIKSAVEAWVLGGTTTTLTEQASTSVAATLKSALQLASKTDTEVTLYANWTPNVLTVNYNANGGTGAPSATAMSYGFNYQLSQTKPVRDGYVFKGWALTTTWNNTRYTTETKSAQDWATALGTSISGSRNASVTVYAQWEKAVTHTFYYFNGQSKTASVTFHNDDDSVTMTIPEEARQTNKTYNGSSDWAFRGFSTSKDSNAAINIASGTTTLTVKNTDSGTTYYASYQRTVSVKWQDYGEDKVETATKTATAYLNYAGMASTPEFTAPALHTMKYTELGANKTKKKETWTARGWTTSALQNAAVQVNVSSKINTNKDTTYYGLYQKGVTITYDVNGGTGLGTTKNNTTGQTISTSMSNNQFSYTRYANAVDVSKATTNTFTFAIPQYLENGISKYIWCGWLYKKLGINEESDMFADYLVGTTNSAGSFTYTPLVSDTIYAYWTYPDGPNPHVPTTTITKSAEWATPTSDNSIVDFDNLQNIDIDGIAKVTVKVKITNKDGISAKTISVTDYFNTDMWDYYQDSTHKANVSKGSITKSGDTITWTIPDGYTSGQEMKLIYYVKLKESFWTVDADGNEVTGNTDYYINAIKDLTSYKKELNADGSLKSTSTYQTKDKKALINLHYTINGGLLSGIPVNKYNSTPYVVMRPVNWIPTVSIEYGIGIESDTNNIYQDKSSDYKNTYFVKYDTKGSNSTFRLFELSQIRRSYSYYQITDNLMDMRTAAKNQEVIDNYLGLNNDRGNDWSDITGTKLSSGFSAKELLKVVSADNIRSSVTTNGVIYKTAALTSYDTVYATNNDGLKISVYPFIKTTNSKTGEIYETTRDTNTLKNKRIDLVIDASDPIITPPDTGTDPIRTEDEDGNKWTESDGYMDINLVDKATNPSPATKTLTFEFEDEVSGINSPDADASDWIDASNKNVQIKLERVDNDPITIFDSGIVPTNQSDVVKVIYDDTASLRNKTGSVKVILDPTNDDILGHLKLTIRVYDNVSNYTEKTYDIYVFCLTGAVEIADTLPDYHARLLELNRFANGELGSVNVSAGGYVDRVTLDFGEYLDTKYKDEYNSRKNFAADTVKTINGDYPNTDAAGTGAESGIDSSMTYLPYEWQVRTWGYTNDTLGGLKLKNVALDKQVYTVNNSILKEHLSDLIKRYQGMAQGETYAVESGSDYAIVGSTLYTYPIMNGDNVTSYVDKYELSGETYYDNILYPAYATLDGTKSITIIYDSVQPDAEDDENGFRRKIAASVEDTTQIIVSNWVQDGDSYLRPFMHYFYMPLEAEQKNASNPYYVTLTSYKDSEKEFVHSVTIRLSFYNDIEAIHKKLETYIKDN